MSAGRHALVAGEGAFRTEIAARLGADGFQVNNTPDAAVLHALVIDLVTAPDPLPFRAVGDSDLRDALERQLYAFVAMVQAEAPRLGAGDTIVAVVPNAYLGAWGGVQIAAVAAACIAMARSMALELAPRGLRVNCVATARPGDRWDTPAARADIAATVAWLSGAESGQLSGQTILADRGASLKMTQAARR